MTNYDQIETFLAVQYSGSMSSNVLVGNGLTSSITTARTLYNTARVMVGDKWSGIASSSLTSTLFSKWRYSDYYSFAFGRRANGSNQFSTCREDGKFYFDSVMPDIVAIASLNSDAINSGSAFKGDADLNAPGYSAGQAATVYVRNTSQWLQAFPFQTKYKNLGRLNQQGRLLSVSTGSATSLGGVSFQDYGGDFFTILDASSSNPSTDFDPTILPSLYEDQQSILMLLPMELTRKTFFCFGDGLEPKSNEFGTVASARYRRLPTYTFRYFPDPDFLAGPIFRGFRYGIYNANPISPNYIYRRGCFGQMRDLLESPPYSAFIENGTITYPVTIAFASGTSLAASASLYASASSTQTFNPYDSGIYDIHARVGQPFFDRSGD